jgi:hypothetical protein
MGLLQLQCPWLSHSYSLMLLGCVVELLWYIPNIWNHQQQVLVVAQACGIVLAAAVLGASKEQQACRGMGLAQQDRLCYTPAAAPLAFVALHNSSR